MPSEQKPLSDAESAQLDAMLALINDDPEQPVTMPARMLCYVMERTASEARAEAEAERDRLREALGEWFGRCVKDPVDGWGHPLDHDIDKVLDRMHAAYRGHAVRGHSVAVSEVRECLRLIVQRFGDGPSIIPHEDIKRAQAALAALPGEEQGGSDG